MFVIRSNAESAYYVIVIWRLLIIKVLDFFTVH